MLRGHSIREEVLTESWESEIFSTALKQLLREIDQVLSRLRPYEAETLVKELEAAPRVFGFGTGRSGFILRTFCMRLMQLGIKVYYVGETITPRIQPGDLLVVMSGSGETSHTYELLQQAQRRQAKTIAITAHRESSIGRQADMAIVVPGTTKLTLAQEAESFQCPGSLFEQTVFLFLEAVVMIIFQQRLGRDGNKVLARHADLE